MIAGALAALASEARASDLVIRELPDHVTEGRVTVNATPAQVYELVTNYARWRDALSDIEAVKVKSGGREHAKVEFRSRAFGMTVTVAFENEPARVIRFEGIAGPPGGMAHGEYVLAPVDGGKRTEVTGRMFMDAHLPASLFVSGNKVRAMRQQKLRADLTDVARWFSRDAVQVRP